MFPFRVLLATSLAFFASAACAQPPADRDVSLDSWFESLKQPNSVVGCCSVSDCHIFIDGQYREADGQWEVLIDMQWRHVPPGVILQKHDNPTGGAVSCYRVEYENVIFYCFIRPVET